MDLLGGALVECSKKIHLFLMKLRDLIVIGLIKMSTKFRQKMPGTASFTCKTVFANYLKIPWDSRGIVRKLRVFALFKG